MSADKLHVLKCDAKWFRQVIDGRKTAELRLDDRGFEVGDRIELREWSRGSWTALENSIVLLITSIVRSEDGPWLKPGYVMLSFRKLDR